MLTQISIVETPLHRMSAAFKLALLAALGLALAFVGRPGLLAATLVAIWLAYLVGGLALFARAPRLLRPIWPFVLVLGGWHWWRGTPETGSVVVLRMLIMLMAANLLLLTTRLDALIAVFRTLCRPLALFGVPPGRVAVALALTLRYVPVLMTRAGQFREAWQARSPRAPLHRLVAPLTLSALDEAERVAEALRARSGSV